MLQTLKISLTLLLEDFWELFKSTLPDEAMQYDMAAATMEMEGYTDLDIYLELGPRPKSSAA